MKREPIKLKAKAFIDRDVMKISVAVATFTLWPPKIR